MAMASKEHERTAEKVPPCQVTFIVGDQVFSGTSVHLNEGGMLVLCQQPAQLYTKVKMALKFPGVRNPLKISGEVIWTNIHGPADSLSPRGMGIKFLSVDEDVERVIAEQVRIYEIFGDIYSCYYT
jgi:Tfp pilus assembly protein PilZ